MRSTRGARKAAEIGTILILHFTGFSQCPPVFGVVPFRMGVIKARGSFLGEAE
jgi:hypothetical protein